MSRTSNYPRPPAAVIPEDTAVKPVDPRTWAWPSAVVVAVVVAAVAYFRKDWEMGARMTNLESKQDQQLVIMQEISAKMLTPAQVEKWIYLTEKANAAAGNKWLGADLPRKD